jgi:hypothetical protein
MSKFESAAAHREPEKKHPKLVSEVKREKGVEAPRTAEQFIPEAEAWNAVNARYTKLNEEIAKNQEIRTKLRKMGTKPTEEFLTHEREVEAKIQHLDDIIENLKKGTTEEQARARWQEGATALVENPFASEAATELGEEDLIPMEEEKPLPKSPEAARPRSAERKTTEPKAPEDLQSRYDELKRRNQVINWDIKKLENMEQQLSKIIADVKGKERAIDALESLTGEYAARHERWQETEKQTQQILEQGGWPTYLNDVRKELDERIVEKGKVLAEMSDTAEALAASRNAGEAEENEPIPLRRRKQKKAA